MCLYCTKSEPTSNLDNFARAERVVALYFSVRSTLVVTPRPTLAITRVAHFQKISFLIFTAPPPTPPPPGEKIRKEIFGVRGRY